MGAVTAADGKMVTKQMEHLPDLNCSFVLCVALVLFRNLAAVFAMHLEHWSGC